MAKPIPGTPARLTTPKQRNTGQWIVRAKDDSGKWHSRTFKNETLARQWHDEQCAKIPQPEVTSASLSDEFRKYDGSPLWWSDLLGWTAHRLVHAERGRECDEIRRDLLAIATASRGVKSLIDVSALEARMVEIEKKQREVAAARKHGLGTRGDIRVA